jgi:superfamily II DNA or RNA helicase
VSIIFKTGKAHQEQTAIWARQRLADKRGRCFSSPDDQDGVLFADSVGMGKTWEALSAAALVLYKSRPKRGRRHVLILCPANLVTKWEDELAAGSPFRKRLDDWARRPQKSGQAVYARRVTDTLSHVLPIRSGKHVRTRLKRGRFHPPGGTYIISQSLIGRRGRGLSALRREKWDIIIADEAHNAAARKALDALKIQRRDQTRLLLTATPFQLEPRQFNPLARNLLTRPYKPLNWPEVRNYIEQVEQIFKLPTSRRPTPATVQAASQILRKLATRSLPRTSNRYYELLMPDGSVKALPGRLDELDDTSVQKQLEILRNSNGAVRDLGFEAAYFEKRLQLANRRDRTFIATRLRRLLAKGTEARQSPRRVALNNWARNNFERDLRRAIETGLPHKTIVFTSWVGDRDQGEADMLQKLLGKAFTGALDATRQHFGHLWTEWYKTGRMRLQRLAGPVEDTVTDAAEAEVVSVLLTLAEDEVTAVLAGKHPRFVRRLQKALDDPKKAIDEARKELMQLEDKYSFEALAVRRRLKDMQDKLSSRSYGLGFVERYTGSEQRSARDQVANGFREIGQPWVLVASNVGSEGIDLHTYTARIVHYDLEWNPAKMEQREGRGDRVGRQLKDKLAILYCLVPRTYDERMFHQLVARDRWHGVLLGKPATKLKDDESDAPLIDRKKLASMRLDLRPRTGFSRIRRA